ncbi:MAG TPA: hypothetical protein VFY93_06585 [Planctomycetota bacterium]|nr:hypothetical protein [Planctomycetota bacterium]
MRLIPAVLLLFAVARAGAMPEAHAAARRAFVERLEALAAWCQKNELYLDRNRTYELILRFEPDHAEARKGLRYVQREGVWVRPATYTPPRNGNARAQPEYGPQRAAAARQFADDVVAALGKEGAAWTPAARAMAVEDVLFVAPDDERARALNGEVKSDGRWLPADAVSGAARRKELVAAAREALAAVPEPRKVEIGPDAQLGPAFTDAVETDAWRVVSTTGLEEARKAAVIATATVPLFRACFGVAEEERRDQAYYMMAKQADFQSVLEHHPSCTPEFRKFAWEVSSSWLPRTAILLAHNAEASTRLELAARQPTAGLMLRTFGITAKHGWAYEGVGLYLTELLTGTHTTYTVRPSDYARDDRREKAELWSKIRDAQADWFEVARQMAREKTCPDLVDLMSKDVNVMDAADLIFSYVVAAYLLEAHPKEAPALLRAIGERKVPFHDAVPQALGVDVPTLQARIHAWLAERKS